MYINVTRGGGYVDHFGAYCFNVSLSGFAKLKKIPQKNETTMEVAGWVQVALEIPFLEIHPKLLLY